MVVEREQLEGHDDRLENVTKGTRNRTHSIDQTISIGHIISLENKISHNQIISHIPNLNVVVQSMNKLQAHQENLWLLIVSLRILRKRCMEINKRNKRVQFLQHNGSRDVTNEGEEIQYRIRQTKVRIARTPINWVARLAKSGTRMTPLC